MIACGGVCSWEWMAGDFSLFRIELAELELLGELVYVMFDSFALAVDCGCWSWQSLPGGLD